MVEQREIGHCRSRESSMPEGHELNYTSRMAPCFSPEDSKDSFQVVPVRFSHATNLPNKTKSSRMIDMESRKLSNNAELTGHFIDTNETGKQQKSSPFPARRDLKTPPAAYRTETCTNVKTEDLSNWLLLGKSIIPDPECSSAKKDYGWNLGNEDYFLPSRKAEESIKSLHPCSGLHTYPPSIEKCYNPEHFNHTPRKINSEIDNYSAKDHRLGFPSFSSRPLGEPSTSSYTKWQRLRNKKKIEEFITAGNQGQSSQHPTHDSPFSFRPEFTTGK